MEGTNDELETVQPWSDVTYFADAATILKADREVDRMAAQMRDGNTADPGVPGLNRRHDGNQVERGGEWKMLEHKAHKRPQDTEWRPYRIEPFPRAEVATELARRYPWVASWALENPTQRLFAWLEG